jgi:putative endonuclease
MRFSSDAQRIGFVYILASESAVLYIGVTSSLDKRILEHRGKRYESFTKKYNVTKLVYWERHPDITTAIAREKHLKGWLRREKIMLIESQNPTWRDLADDVFPRKKK